MILILNILKKGTKIWLIQIQASFKQVMMPPKKQAEKVEKLVIIR